MHHNWYINNPNRTLCLNSTPLNHSQLVMKMRLKPVISCCLLIWLIAFPTELFTLTFFSTFIWIESESVSCSVLSDSETLWTVVHQAPLSMGFSRQEYWSGLPFPSPGDLPPPGLEPWASPMQVDSKQVKQWIVKKQKVPDNMLNVLKTL